LPNNLTHIVFGYDFNMQLDNYILPSKLEKITICKNYTYLIELKCKLKDTKVILEIIG
jgi:hypothetical protein